MTESTMSRAARAVALLILLTGCARQDPESAIPPAPVAGADLDDAAWTEELMEHRREIDAEIRTSKTSPMAGTQYLKSEPADRVYLTREGRTFGLAYSAPPAAAISVTRDDGSWTWEDRRGDVTCELDGEPVATGSTLDGPATFSIAGLYLGFHPGDDRVTFIVYDPERPEKTSFEHLLYFPPDRRYAVPATLVEIPEPDPVEMLTSQGLKKTFYRYARIRFQVNGEEKELTAYKSTLDSKSLFIPFRDATSGRETYGAGRFMDLEEAETESFVMDFNRAYNPLCNYSPGFNCPIPPRENHLDVAVRAGERTYPH